MLGKINENSEMIKLVLSLIFYAHFRESKTQIVRATDNSRKTNPQSDTSKLAFLHLILYLFR